MARRRLIPADHAEEAARKVTAAVADAVAEQRRAVTPLLRAHGLTAAGAPSRLWPQAGWAKAVDHHVAPVAAAVAAGMVAAGRASLPVAATWGAAGSATAMADHVTSTVLDAGDRLADIVDDASDGDDPEGAVADALDSAADWLGSTAGRVTMALAGWAAVDLLSHAAGQGQAPGYTVTWNATGDQATRADHADADGQTVAPGDTFSVGGEDLAFPGDPSGSDDNTLNCRCWLTYDDGIGDDGTGDSGDDGVDGGGDGEG